MDSPSKSIVSSTSKISLQDRISSMWALLSSAILSMPMGPTLKKMMTIISLQLKSHRLSLSPKIKFHPSPISSLPLKVINRDSPISMIDFTSIFFSIQPLQIPSLSSKSSCQENLATLLLETTMLVWWSPEQHFHFQIVRKFEGTMTPLSWSLLQLPTTMGQSSSPFPIKTRVTGSLHLASQAAGITTQSLPMESMDSYWKDSLARIVPILVGWSYGCLIWLSKMVLMQRWKR